MIRNLIFSIKHLTFNIFLLALVIIFAAVGCKHKTKPIPSGIIDKETMVNIIVDVNLSEAIFRLKQPSYPQDSNYVRAYYDVIFNKYKISKEQFNSSLKYYTKHPEKFGEIYDETLNRLTRMQSEENSKNINNSKNPSNKFPSSSGPGK